MALAKIKVNEVDTKATPVLADSVLLSDSADYGRCKISPVETILGIIKGTPPSTLDTLAKLAAAINNDPAFHSTLTTALGLKAPLASPALTGTPTAPTAAVGTNTTQIATTAFVQNKFGAWDMVTGRKHFDDSGTGTEGVEITRYNIRTVRSNYGIIPQSTAGTSTLFIGGASNKYASLNLENAGVVSATTPAAGTNTTQLATTAFVQAATASAIYDLPVTRSGLASPGTDVVLFETGVLDPAWYDETHVLNVSFFARNDSGLNNNTTFKLQLYDEGTSTAHTIASITADTLDFDLLQASIYRASSSSVNCNIQYGYLSEAGYVSLAAGSYKLRVVCTSTLSTVFGAAQVRFTK